LSNCKRRSTRSGPGADDFECDLILSARRDAPRPAALRRTLATIGVGVSLPLGVASVAEGAVVVPVKLGAVALTKWLATGVALGVATAGGAKLTERALEPARPAVVTTAAGAKRAAPRPLPRATATGSTEAPPVIDEPAAVLPAPAAAPAALAAGAVLPPAVAPSASLPEEVRSLDTARQALAEGDARGALALLRRYDARFGTGALLPEARVLEVKALLAAGERARAVAAARRIVELDPKSPHAEAVRALVGRSSFP
jgi:hypothetical protein